MTGVMMLTSSVVYPHAMFHASNENKQKTTLTSHRLVGLEVESKEAMIVFSLREKAIV